MSSQVLCGLYLRPIHILFHFIHVTMYKYLIKDKSSPEKIVIDLNGEICGEFPQHQDLKHNK